MGSPVRHVARLLPLFLLVTAAIVGVGVATVVLIRSATHSSSTYPSETLVKKVNAELRGTGLTAVRDARGTLFITRAAGVARINLGAIARAAEEINKAGCACRVDLSGSEVDDDSVQAILRIVRVYDLDLGDTGLSDAGLISICHAPLAQNLKRLNVERCAVSAEAIVESQHISQLKDLYLAGTSIMPGSLEPWNAPSTLTRLDVSEIDFDDACCHSLSHCWELEEVNLADTLVTDSGLASLADKQQLKYLDLRRTKVTGKEFGAGVASLAFIDASGSDFSDTGVRALAKLGKLREVRLVGTNVTDTGIEELVRSHYQSGISLKLAVSGPLVSRRKVNELRGDSSIVVIDVFGPPLRD